MSKTVSIIGCGNLGFPLANILLQEGYLVKGSTTSESKLKLFKQQGIQPYLINIEAEDIPLLDDFLQTDIVVITFPPAYRKIKGGKSYFEQLQRLSKHIQKVGVNKVIFTSSTDVYPQLGQWVSEEDAESIPPRFTDVPVLSLESIFTEQISFKTTIIRLAGLMGPSYSGGIHIAGKNVKGAEDLINMVHQDDCVAVMHRIIQQNEWGQEFNVVADEHPTKREYYNRLCDSQGFARPNFVMGESAYRIVSNKKLKKMLNYQFLYPDPMVFLQ